MRLLAAVIRNLVSCILQMSPTDEEVARRNQVIGAIIVAVDCNQTIRLPGLHSASQTSDYEGTLGEYHYQFEGEDDLLHLAVTRIDKGELMPEEGQAVASFLLRGLPPGLLWIRPGQYSQHFYCGHDDLVQNVLVP